MKTLSRTVLLDDYNRYIHVWSFHTLSVYLVSSRNVLANRYYICKLPTAIYRKQDGSWIIIEFKLRLSFV